MTQVTPPAGGTIIQADDPPAQMPPMKRTRRISLRLRRVTPFEVAAVAIAAIVAIIVFAALVRLAIVSWDTYGGDIIGFYRTNVLDSSTVRQAFRNTAIVCLVSTILAVFIGSILAWLNERTDASIGSAGRVLPLVPFLMPAIALPLGWLFLASPNTGIVNVILRHMLSSVGIHLQTGPLNVYSWYGLIFLYTVILTGFAYLVLASPVRDIDSRLEDAGRMSGAGPLKILFRIVLPVLRPAMVNAFFLCMMISLVMVSVPLTIAETANIPIISVVLVNYIVASPLPEFAQAFLTGILLIIPIVVLWFLQRRAAQRQGTSVVGAKVVSSTRLRLGGWRKALGRVVFLGYVVIGVALPVAGLLYVAGQKYWTDVWPPAQWNPWPNLSSAFTNQQTQPAIMWSVLLGLSAGAALILAAYVMSYGQRLFPRLGSTVDVIAKSPAVVTQILIGVALLLVFAGAPFHLAGTAWILFIGYFVVFLPFASVVTTGALHEVGNDLVESAQLSGSSDFRIFWRIATPLTWPTLVAGFLLMYVVISGEVNISLMLSTPARPVVGLVMVDIYSFGSLPQVAGFALAMTALNVVIVAILMRLLNRRRAWAR